MVISRATTRIFDMEVDEAHQQGTYIHIFPLIKINFIIL